MEDSYNIYVGKIIRRLIILGKLPMSLMSFFKQGELSKEELINYLIELNNQDIVKALYKDIINFAFAVNISNMLYMIFDGNYLNDEVDVRNIKKAYINVVMPKEKIATKSIRKPKINAAQAQPKRYVRTKR